jgi:hypothetical protein
LWCGIIGIVRKNSIKKGAEKMMKLSAYVIELPDNAYKVGIEGVYTGIVSCVCCYG